MVRAMTGLRARRQLGFESFDFEHGQADLKRRRQANLERLDDLLDEFRARLEEVGGRFHLAADAKAAREIIAGICRDAGAGLVVKSKSMATEEILLNPHLESLGMEVVETEPACSASPPAARRRATPQAASFAASASMK